MWRVCFLYLHVPFSAAHTLLPKQENEEKEPVVIRGGAFEGSGGRNPAGGNKSVMLPPNTSKTSSFGRQVIALPGLDNRLHDGGRKSPDLKLTSMTLTAPSDDASLNTAVPTEQQPPVVEAAAAQLSDL